MITPVTLLTGFLGSGKTTLLARALADPRFADTAVVVNEWGEAPIDHALLREASGEVTAIAGGCICCSLAGEVAAALREMHFARAAGRMPAHRRVVIETTGLAEPAPLAACLGGIALAGIRHALAGIVTAVDGVHGMAVLDAHAVARRQAAMADRIVVTKSDLAPAEALARLEARLAALAPAAALSRSGARPLEAAALFEFPAGVAPRSAPSGHAHDASIRTFTWRDPEPRPWADVETVLRSACTQAGERLLRLKGLVNAEAEPGPRAVHAIGHTLYPSVRLSRWPDDDRATRLVFIGQDLEEAAIASILQR